MKEGGGDQPRGGLDEAEHRQPVDGKRLDVGGGRGPLLVGQVRKRVGRAAALLKLVHMPLGNQKLPRKGKKNKEERRKNKRTKVTKKKKKK